MEGLRFEWHKAKNASNQRKHGVSFEEARTAFADEFGRMIADPEHSEEEERFILMGFECTTPAPDRCPLLQVR